MTLIRNHYPSDEGLHYSRILTNRHRRLIWEQDNPDGLVMWHVPGLLEVWHRPPLWRRVLRWFRGWSNV